MRSAKVLAGFLSVQVIVQALTMLTGLILVRTMSKTDYALYTVANTMQGTISVLSDVGVASALSATGGLVWQDRTRFGQLLATGLAFRRRLAFAGSVGVGPVMWWLLSSHGASPIMALSVTALVLMAVNFQLSNSVLGLAPRLHTRIRQLQRFDLYSTGSRLLLVGAVCWLWRQTSLEVGLTIAVVAVAAVICWLQAVYLRRLAARDADLDATPSPEDRQTIWKVVRQQAPNSIYYCVQGQIIFFLIATLGNTDTVAEVGALGRITVIFTILGTLMSNIVLPRFARCQEVARLRVMYLQIVAGYLSLSVLLVFLAAVAPGPFLWLLGPKYAHLQHELVYMMFSAVVSATFAALFWVNSTRGWLQGTWVMVPITLICQAALVPLLDLRTVEGVVLLGALPPIPGILPYVYRVYRSLWNGTTSTPSPETRLP